MSNVNEKSQNSAGFTAAVVAVAILMGLVAALFAVIVRISDGVGWREDGHWTGWIFAVLLFLAFCFAEVLPLPIMYLLEKRRERKCSHAKS